MDFLTVEDAAKELNVTVGAMRHLINDGRIPFHKIVGRIKISRPSFEKFLRSCECVSAEEAHAARHVTEREKRLLAGRELRAYIEKHAPGPAPEEGTREEATREVCAHAA